MSITKKSLDVYMDTAHKLAEQVKSDIQKSDRKLTKKTVLALNNFLIAANELVDFAARIKEDGSETDPNLQ